MVVDEQLLVVPPKQAPVHSGFKICDFFAKNQANVLDHPPYSPDLAPCDFFLFCKIKNTLNGDRFQSVEDIQKNSTAAFKGFKEEEFRVCFEQWKHHIEKCIQSGVTILRVINFLTL